jgi:hypothetical protein
MPCVCCLSEDTKEIVCLTVADRKLYQELTKLKLTSNRLKICQACKLALQTSSSFVQLCNKSFELLPNILKKDTVTRPKRTKKIKLDETEDESSLFECAAIDTQASEDDELPISKIQERLQKNKENVKVAQSVNKSHDETLIDSQKNKKSFHCDECGTECSTSQRLQIHSLTHSGIKSWKCEECNKVFATKFRLKAHSSDFFS